MCRAGTARINACGIVRLLTTMKQEAPPFMGGAVHDLTTYYDASEQGYGASDEPMLNPM